MQLLHSGSGCVACTRYVAMQKKFALGDSLPTISLLRTAILAISGHCVLFAPDMGLVQQDLLTDLCLCKRACQALLAFLGMISMSRGLKFIVQGDD